MHFGPEDDAGVSSQKTTQTTPSHSQAVELARRFHDAYERLAPQFGYITREDTRAFDPESSNGKLMTAVCAELTSQQEVAAPVSDAGSMSNTRRKNLLNLMQKCGGRPTKKHSEDGPRLIVSADDLERFLDASPVPVASLASREQGVEAVGAVPDRAWEETLKQRDYYHDVADELAEQLAAITGEDIGEHSSANNPWQNAVNAATEFRARTAPPSSKTQDDLAVADSGRVQGVEPADEIYEDPLCDCGQSQYVAHSCAYQNGHDIYAKASQPKAPAPVPVAQGEAVPDLFTQGVNAAAEMLDKMADDFANEHSSQDPDTGVYEFGRGGKEDHYNTLRELADDIRSIVLGNPAPEQATTGSGQDSERLDFLLNSPSRYAELSPSGMWRVYEDKAPANATAADWRAMSTRYERNGREAIDAAILSTASPAGEGDEK